MDVESLRVFRQLVAAEGFTAAAERLGVTQSAVSHKIRRLEERIGRDLLRRDGQSFVLTPDGRDLLAHAEAIVDAHDRAVDALQRSNVSGTVRLGCNEEVAATQLAEVA
ncbi:MAG TPA: LysR family transcriptional regulator, partial [Acidimicrobiaceae bacterium]|nr:LysR family transcriptional regulator [Acidimicrobiaceae bacterium]